MVARRALWKRGCVELEEEQPVPAPLDLANEFLSRGDEATTVEPQLLLARLEAVTKALAAARARAERFWEPEVHRLRGEPLRRAGRRRGSGGRGRSLGEAEASSARALNLARRLRARSFELCAGISLSRLCRESGQGEAACALLARAYREFTEGWGTPDLRTARGLWLTRQA